MTHGDIRTLMQAVAPPWCAPALRGGQELLWVRPPDSYTWLLCPSASVSFGWWVWPRQRIGDYREYRHAHAYHQRKHGDLLAVMGPNASTSSGFHQFRPDGSPTDAQDGQRDGWFVDTVGKWTASAVTAGTNGAAAGESGRLGTAVPSSFLAT
jgi:hypothetical protein